MARITELEMKKRIKDYDKYLKENGGIPRIPSQEEQDEFYENLDKLDPNVRTTITDKIMNGDNYSSFQNLDNYIRTMLGLTFTKMIVDAANGDYSLNNKKLVEVLNKYAYNPGIREGISVLKHTDLNFKKIDDYMNQVLFNRTMDVPTKEQREKVFNYNI